MKGINLRNTRTLFILILISLGIWSISLFKNVFFPTASKQEKQKACVLSPTRTTFEDCKKVLLDKYIVNIALDKSVNLKNFLIDIREKREIITKVLIEEVPYLYKVRIVNSTSNVPFESQQEALPPLHFKAINKTVPFHLKKFSLKPIYNHAYDEINSNPLAAVIAGKILNYFSINNTVTYFWAKFYWGNRLLSFSIGKNDSEFKYNGSNPHLLTRKFTDVKNDEDRQNDSIISKILLTLDRSLLIYVLLADDDGVLDVEEDNFYISRNFNGNNIIYTTDLDFSFSACSLTLKSSREKYGLIYHKIIDTDFSRKQNTWPIIKNLFSQKNILQPFADKATSLINDELNFLNFTCRNDQTMSQINSRLCQNEEQKRFAREMHESVKCAPELARQFLKGLIMQR